MIGLRRRRLVRGRPAHLVVRIRGGEQHEWLFARCGAPVRVAFRREDAWPGSRLVVFPALGRGLTLAPGQEVEVLLPAEAPAVHEFESEGGLHGRIEIRAAGGEA